MCYFKVTDVDAVYEAFAQGLKAHSGKVPRTGIPRLSKVRDLSMDRRFTLTDTGGNTLYVGTPHQGSFLRDLDNAEQAESFALLYDLLYSKEDIKAAAKVLPRVLAGKDSLAELDRARVLLVTYDIAQQQDLSWDEGELETLCQAQAGPGRDKIRQRYAALKAEDAL